MLLLLNGYQLEPNRTNWNHIEVYFSCLLYSFTMLYAHYMFSLSLSAFGLFFLLAFCNPANQRALLLISRSANLNTSLLRQSNNETHMYVLARNLSNTSIAHYKRFLQYGVFIGACFHIPLVFKDQMEWFFAVLCLVCTYKCNGLQITYHYLQGTRDMKK